MDRLFIQPAPAALEPGRPVSQWCCASKCERVLSGEPAPGIAASTPCCHSGKSPAMAGCRPNSLSSASVLDALEPAATASMCGADLVRLGLQAGQQVRIASRRGEVQLQLRRDDGTPAGAVFMPFAYVEAAANELTHAALDPFGKIPEFKYCAVRVSALQPA